MHECFEGFKSSECESMNCVNGHSKKQPGDSFTTEQYSQKVTHQIQIYCKLLLIFLLTYLLKWDVITTR